MEREMYSTPSCNQVTGCDVKNEAWVRECAERNKCKVWERIKKAEAEKAKK